MPAKRKGAAGQDSSTKRPKTQDGSSTQSPAVHSDDEDDEDDDEYVAPFQRLYPSAIRLQPDSAGRFHYRDGTRVNFDDMNRMNDEYLLKVDPSNPTSAIFTFRLSAKDLKEKVRLPMKYVGTPASFKHTPVKDHEYKHTALVRNNVAKQAFARKFMQNKFNMQRYLLVVPVLSEAEEKEYVANRATFLTKMMAPTALRKRFWWICDGANRWQLCKNLDYEANLAILDPSIPEQGCMRYATFQNDDVDTKNETTYMVYTHVHTNTHWCAALYIVLLLLFGCPLGQDPYCGPDARGRIQRQAAAEGDEVVDEHIECRPKIRAGPESLLCVCVF